jgi:hypothetical protein
MAKNTKFYTIDDQGWLLIPSQNGEPVEEMGVYKNSEIPFAMSAISAFGDVLKFGWHDHPLTDINVHIKKGALNGAFMESEIGYISTKYAGDLPFPIPHPSEYPEGWALISVLDEVYSIDHIPHNRRGFACRKHSYMNLVLRGGGLHVRLYPLNYNKDNNGLGWWDKVLMGWEETNLEKAEKIANDNINESNEKKEIYKKTKAFTQNGGIVTRRGAATGSVVIVTREGEEVDITHKEPCVLLGIDRRGKRHSMVWDERETSRAQVAAAADIGYTFILEE